MLAAVDTAELTVDKQEAKSIPAEKPETLAATLEITDQVLTQMNHNNSVGMRNNEDLKGNNFIVG